MKMKIFWVIIIFLLINLLIYLVIKHNYPEVLGERHSVFEKESSVII